MRLGTRLRRVEHDRFDEMVRCPRGEIGTRTRKRTITSVKPIVVRHEPRVQPRVYTCSRCAGQDPQSSSCGFGQVGELIRDHLEIAFGQRSEERRVGKGGDGKCRYWWWAYH